MSRHEARTNFAQYSHQQLYAMLYAGDPNSARTAANGWDSTANALHSQANTLEGQLSGFKGNWSGGAADQYTTMVNDLIGGIRKVADTAYAMRNLATDVADAQETARAQMPPPVDVPTVPAAVLALASSPIQVDASTPASVVAQMQQARAQAVAAVQNQQQVSATADAAHAKAVQVMTNLAGNYVSTQADIPPAPDAQLTPQVPQGSAITGASAGGKTPITTNLTSFTTGQPTTTKTTTSTLTGTGTGTTAKTANQGLPANAATAEQDSPLFGNMFTAGVAAASAAVFGRFGSIIPKVPGFVNKNKNNDSSSGGTNTGTDGTTPKLGDRAAAIDAAKLDAAKLGGGGGGLGALKSAAIGGGVGRISGLGASGVGGAGAGGVGSFSGNLLSGANSASALESGVAAAGAAGANTAGGTPMMPMMPMSGMGGSDMGGGRRIPPWLMETEDVWTESSPVAPTVIGEDPLT